MKKLSVNINKVATLRNARGGNVPDVVQFAKDCEAFGADGITVHPRPDERHITRADVYALKDVLHVEFNIEGYPSESFIRMVSEVRPAQVTLVPDSPDQLTSNHGWNTVANKTVLTHVVELLHHAGCRVSIFVDPEPAMVEGAKMVGADRVELYTGPFAEEFDIDADRAVAPFTAAAIAAHNAGLGLNAGHDLNLHNLRFFQEHVPYLMEVSIGHALIADALYLGLEKTIQAYKDCLK